MPRMGALVCRCGASPRQDPIPRDPNVRSTRTGAPECLQHPPTPPRVIRDDRHAATEGDVTIVDRTNDHLFQPLLYRVAIGILSEGLIAPALRTMIQKQAKARVLLAGSGISTCRRER